MTTIAAVAPVLPPHVWPQQQITDALGGLMPPRGDGRDRRAVLQRMHASTTIERRHTVLPLDEYARLTDFGTANDLWIEHGTALASEAASAALAAAGLGPSAVDFVLFTSVTGIAAPSIDALLVPRLGLRSDVKRMPSFGLGCVAGAAGLARVHDYLVGHPLDVGLLISVELCSLTLQRSDATVANMVATGLFGDGAAAVVLVGDAHPLAARGDEARPTVIGTRSALLPDSVGAIGWHVGGSGFEIVLTPDVAGLVEEHLPAAVADFLADHGLERPDVDVWFAHPGGPRILDAFGAALGLTDADLAASRRSLREVGNLSSASVLHLLADGVAQPRGTRGLVLALGPGVSAEFVLLEWT